MYQWQFSPVDSSLPFVLTDCPGSDSAAQTQFELRSRLLPQNKATIVTCVASHTARAIHLTSPVINKRNGRKLYSSHAWSKERRELSVRKFSLWLTYSTCNNVKKKTTTKKSICVHYTTAESVYSRCGCRQRVEAPLSWAFRRNMLLPSSRYKLEAACFVRNVGTHLQNHTASLSTKRCFEYIIWWNVC